jgi:hypothetical protein
MYWLPTEKTNQEPEFLSTLTLLVWVVLKVCPSKTTAMQMTQTAGAPAQLLMVKVEWTSFYQEKAPFCATPSSMSSPRAWTLRCAFPWTRLPRACSHCSARHRGQERWGRRPQKG